MAYDPTKLALNDPTDLDWALAWARKFSGDRLEPELQTDDEWRAELTADSLSIHGVTYYRPQQSAARLIAADPDWALDERLTDLGARNRPPAEVAAAIRRSGAWVDELIREAAGMFEAEAALVSVRPGF